MKGRKAPEMTDREILEMLARIFGLGTPDYPGRAGKEA